MAHRKPVFSPLRGRDRAAPLAGAQAPKTHGRSPRASCPETRATRLALSALRRVLTPFFFRVRAGRLWRLSDAQTLPATTFCGGQRLFLGMMPSSGAVVGSPQHVLLFFFFKQAAVAGTSLDHSPSRPLRYVVFYGARRAVQGHAPKQPQPVSQRQSARQMPAHPGILAGPQQRQTPCHSLGLPSPPVPPHDWPQAGASSRPQPASRPSLLGRPRRPEGATKHRNIGPCRSRLFSRCVCDEWRCAFMRARRMRALAVAFLRGACFVLSRGLLGGFQASLLTGGYMPWRRWPSDLTILVHEVITAAWPTADRPKRASTARGATRARSQESQGPPASEAHVQADALYAPSRHHGAELQSQPLRPCDLLASLLALPGASRRSAERGGIVLAMIQGGWALRGSGKPRSGIRPSSSDPLLPHSSSVCRGRVQFPVTATAPRVPLKINPRERHVFPSIGERFSRLGRSPCLATSTRATIDGPGRAEDGQGRNPDTGSFREYRSRIPRPTPL